MRALDPIRDQLPEPAKDIGLNLQSVLAESSLTPAQRWGVAVCSAATARNRPLLDAITAAARAVVDPTVVDDALAAAALMAMNNDGCEICVQSHEKAVLDGGLTDDNVHDAVRIAAVVHAAAVALESAGVAAAA